jgi:hypothetical protein
MYIKYKKEYRKCLFLIINLKRNELSNLKIVAASPARVIYKHKVITERKCRLCIPCTFYTKHVYLNEDLLIRWKHVDPLNSFIFNCVDCYYVITNLKHNTMSNLKIPLSTVD